MSIENDFKEVHSLIKVAKERAFHAVNYEMIALYWQVGKYVLEKLSSQKWGSSVVKNLSEYIKRNVSIRP